MKIVSLTIMVLACAGTVGGCGYRYADRSDQASVYYQPAEPPGYVTRYGTYNSQWDYYRHYNGIDGRGEN